MKYALLVGALVAATLAMPCLGQTSGPHESEFRAFYADFLKAARTNDKEKLAGLIVFPTDDWSIETKGNVQTGSIKDRADFLARYNVLFTSSMRLHVQKAKVQASQSGWYTSWKDADSEFSFGFVYIEGVGFRVGSYNIGPL